MINILVFVVGMILSIAYLVCGAKQINHNEVGIRRTLGKLGNKILGPGLHLSFFIFQDFLIFTTGLEEFEFETNVVTREEGEYSPVEAKVKISLRFLWPNTNNLLGVVKFLKSSDREYLKDIFYDAVADIAEEAAGKMNWKEAFTNKRKFLDYVKESLLADAENIINKCNFREVQLLLIDMEIPADLKESLKAPEVAERQAKAKIKEAEGYKESVKIKAEGDANRIKKTYRAVTEQEEGLRIRELEAMEEIGKGPGNFVISIEGLSQALKGVGGLGRVKKFFKGPSQDDRKGGGKR